MIAGIDLAAKEKKASGVALLYKKKNEKRIKTFVCYSDFEIIEKVKKAKIIAIDAPLGWPKKGTLRECDKKLAQYGVRFFPLNFEPMSLLTKRGISLAKKIKKLNKKVKIVETFPGAFYDIYKVKRKGKGAENLIRKICKKEGIKLRIKKQKNKKIKQDIIDAIACCLAAFGFKEKKFFCFFGRDGKIFIYKN